MQLAVVTTYYNEVEIIDKVVEALFSSNMEFHLYLVDDCSSLPPTNVLEELKENPRFHYIRNKENLGGAQGLNKGIRMAIEDGAMFIAVNDADDIPYPNRFQDQLAAFDTDPNLAIVGGGADMVDFNTGALLWKKNHPEDNAAIYRTNKLNSPFVHSTVIYRSKVFKKIGFYNPEAYAFDYEFITRALKAGFKAANVPATVVKYNIRQNSMSVSKRREQVGSRLKVQIQHFEFLNIWSYIGVVRSCLAYVSPNTTPGMLKTLHHRYLIARQD